MNTKQKTLKEAILRDPERGQPAWDRLVAKATLNPYFQRIMKERMRLMEAEGVLQGDVDTETDATDALGVVYDQIIMGVEEHHPLDFARIFNTDKTEIKVPIGTHGKAKQRAAAGTFSAGEKTTSMVTIAIDKEYGVDISWTKAHIEDATWDVLAEQMQGAGYALQLLLSTKLTAEIKAITAANSAGGAFVTIAATTAITWAEFLALVGAVDIGGTGPADFVLVTPARYWQLLALSEFTSLLYGTSEEVMRTGVARTMIGVTVIRCHSMADVTCLGYDTEAGGDLAVGNWIKGAGGAIGRIAAIRVDASTDGVIIFDDDITGTFVADEVLTEYDDAACTSATGVTAAESDTLSTVVSTASIIALNSKKALALAYRRQVEIEPFEYPDQNRYGFIASVRAKADTLVPSAVAISDQ